MCTLLGCIVLGLVIGHSSPPLPPTQFAGGAAWVSDISSNYQAGKYTTFLGEMERWYQAGQNIGRWKPLLQSEEELTSKYNTPQGQKVFQDLLTKSKNYNNALNQLKQDRNQQLLKIAKANPGSSLSQIIQDKLKHELSPDQLKAFEAFQEWLSPFPLHEPTPLLTQLKQVNFESTVKELLLSAAYQQGNARSTEVPFLGKLDDSLLDEYQVVLTLDKLNKMVALTKKSQEKDISQVVATVSQAFPIIAAQIYDTKAIERAIANPSTLEEHEVANILKTYNDKRHELLGKFGLKK